MRRFLIAALLLTFPLAESACFNYDEPVCAYACDPKATDACPEDYECRTDGYCHLHGSTESCSFTDASVAPDQSVPIDMSNADGAGDL